MTDSAKVWVYQSSREFTAEEVVVVNDALKGFVDSWQAHGAELTADFELVENRFIVLFVDESRSAASGCSVDSSVALIRDIERKYDLNLTDKGQVAFRSDYEIEVVAFKDIKAAVASTKITPSTIIFNNSVATYKEYKESWQIKSEDSWMKRYFM